MGNFKKSDIFKRVSIIPSRWNDTYTEELIGRRGRIREVHSLGFVDVRIDDVQDECFHHTELEILEEI